jgi:regulator of protease activity HflC (stomatin/prohibitin superfamily)
MSKILFPFVMVPQMNVMLIERFGKYVRPVQSGIHFKMPFFEYVAYQHSLKEQVIDIDSQTAITKDNVKIRIDGVLYYKVTDPVKASYEVS